MNKQTINLETDTLSILNELIGMQVISTDKGKRVGTLEDLLLDPNMLEVAAIVTQKGDPLRNDFRAIPSDAVQVWGRDAVLVAETNILCAKNQLPDIDNWLSFLDNILDESVVTTSSNRIGRVEDILINVNGRINAYILRPTESRSRSSKGEENPAVRRIPVLATHALGTEILMVNENDLS
jgi:sporulation protein YlmC with PRC-barrel domain